MYIIYIPIYIYIYMYLKFCICIYNMCINGTQEQYEYRIILHLTIQLINFRIYIYIQDTEQINVGKT